MASEVIAHTDYTCCRMICHVTVDFLHYLKILIILALWLIEVSALADA